MYKKEQSMRKSYLSAEYENIKIQIALKEIKYKMLKNGY